MKLTPYDQEYIDIKEALLDKMNMVVSYFESELSKKYTRATVAKYKIIAIAFNEYIYGYTDHLTYEDVSVVNANSKFIAQTKYDSLYEFDSKEIKYKLKRFIVFLDEHGFHNPKVFNSMFK